MDRIIRLLAPSWRTWRALGACAALLLTGCAEEKSAPAAPPKTVSEYFAIRVGERSTRLQFAVLPFEQQRGLMERRDLGTDDGMIFVYRQPQPASYWMRNTPTPLDIGFFGPDGTLLEVYPLYPYDETGVKSRSDRVKYAVEMPQGWYARNGVRPGARLDLKAIAAALTARGFSPAQYRIDP